MNKIVLIIFSLVLLLTTYSCKKKDKTYSSNEEERPEITEVPKLKGNLVYHNYTNYEANDSEMYLYDFETNNLERINTNWNIINAMNAHFSPDGKQITFMGKDNSTNSWDIYLYTIGSSEHPINLTPLGNTRDEDPKFSPDGKYIAFKHDWRVAQINIETKEITIITDYDYSMPYYNFDGTKLVCSKDDGPTSAIYTVDIASKEITKLYDAPSVQDYYPINADNTSFFYSVGYHPDNTIDQVYRGYWDGSKSKRLPFNDIDGDYSDAYPVDKEWVILCSTRPGGEGNYDLYIANSVSGEIFPMTDYNKNINTPKNELGPSVFIKK